MRRKSQTINRQAGACSSQVDLNDWASCLLLGISRCRTIDRLHTMYRDWKDQIEAHPRRDEIIEAMRGRKEELQ